MTERMPLRDIARELGRRAELLARELLPHGRREGREWRVGSLAGEPGSSLVVQLTGPKAGLWIDHNGETESGDALDLVAAVRYAGHLSEAVTWAKAWLGLSDAAAPAARAAPPPPTEPAPGLDPGDTAERIAAARKIWLAANPLIARTPVEEYLSSRGISLADLGRQPRALRFHRSLWCAEAHRTYPAMVAAISSPAGEHIATHRTWLSYERANWTKAPLAAPKKVLGVKAGGWIALRRGASGRPIRDALPGEAVAIAEGIETGLSIAMACPELRVLAAVDVGNFRRLDLPAAIGAVILCADHDVANPQADDALARAVARFEAEGRKVRVAMPPEPGADWNDILQRAA